MGVDTWPWRFSEQMPQAVPLSLRDLVGHPLRVVKFGDLVTQEYVAGRVTIYLDKSGFIADLGIEKGAPGA